jgi:predicted DNA-binding transcriptional regulator YafY
MAGLPIYSLQGRNGGWRLAGGGRTDLSGLTAAEARALFLVAGPSSAATPQVKAALRKLVRALPEPFRPHAEAASEAVVVDPRGWDQGRTGGSGGAGGGPGGPGGGGPAGGTRQPPEFLDAVQRAVVEGEQVTLGYVARNREPSTRVVHPLGLAAKGWAWYLVADTDAGLRTFRVDRMTSVEPTGEAVVRPPGFVLAEAWNLIAEEVDQRRTPVKARAVVQPAALGWCRWTFGNRLRIGPPQSDGRVEGEVRGHSLRSLAAEVAGFGGHVEVLEPPDLRHHLSRIAAELSATYRTRGPVDTPATDANH